MNLQKEGIVYTPEEITTFIAKTTIDKFLVGKLNNKFSVNLLHLDTLFEKYIRKDKEGKIIVDLSIIKEELEQFKYIFKVLKSLTVLDPAVGSGQFLIAALYVLEKLFLNLRCLKITNWSKYKIRKHIISNIIYGVDIEIEAIRNTKQRLLMTLTDLVEDIDDNSFLPNIDSNYKIGNAIIGFVRHSEIKIHNSINLDDCFYNEIKSVFQSHNDLRKIKLTEKEKKGMLSNLKPFHWFLEFPDVMSNGGFDVIIENPPYISNKQLTPLEKAIFQKRFKTLKGLMNTFGVFIERSIELCHSFSRISYIVHKNLIRSNNYDLLRKNLLLNTTIEEIIDVGAGAFHSVTAETIIIILTTTPPSEDHKILIKTKYPNQKLFNTQDILVKHISQKTFLEQDNYNINLNLQYYELEIIKHIRENKDCELFDFFEAKTCIATGDDKKFLANRKVNELYKKTLRGKNIGRFFIDFDDLYVHYNPKLLHRARDESIFQKPEKLIMQTISSNLTVAYDNNNYYPLSTCIAIIPKDNLDRSFNIKSLLLLMNSKLMNFYYDFTFNLGAHLTTEISVNNINRLPLKLINDHDVFIILGDFMNTLNGNITKREYNENFIEILDDLIDVLIYELIFYNKFQSDSLNTNILSRVSQYVANKNSTMVEQIKECIKNIQDDEVVNFEIKSIKTHPWIKIIENYF